MDEQAVVDGVKPRAGPDERISTLLADRPCSRCLFNLVGQSIVRERHYGLLVVRCPECGTVASLQEYPLLGRWANRWAAIAAALWLLVAAAATFGIAGVMFGFTVGTMELAPQPLAKAIADSYEAHQKASGIPVNQMSGWWNIDPTWWAAQDRAALLQECGGWTGAINWWGLSIWLLALTVLFPLASVWAVGACHRRGLRLVITFVPMMLIAAGYFALSYAGGSRWLQSTELAARILWPVLLPLCALLATLPLLLGAYFGRPLARLFVTLWLPPRLRVPLSFMWICDGKTPPRPQW